VNPGRAQRELGRDDQIRKMIHYSTAIAKMYEAAEDPALWSPSLTEFAKLFGGSAATMVTVDKNNNITQFISGNVDDRFIREYESYYKDISPRLKFFRENSDNYIQFDHMHNSEESLDDDEYYEWIQSFDLKYYLGGRLSDPEAEDSFLAILRNTAQGHVNDSTIAVFRNLRQHLERALQIGRRIERLVQESEAAWTTIDRSPRGVFVLDGDLRVYHSNAEARRILGDSDCLRIVQGRLQATKSTDDIRLQSLIAEAAAAAATRSQLHEISSIVIERPTGSCPLIASAAPSFAPPGTLIVCRPGVVVFVRDPADEFRQSVRRFSRDHNLTPKENLLVESLLSGDSLKHYSKKEAISEETARWHLKNVFQKTGCHRQSELIALVQGTYLPII
jgi:DNA-binding CsgD family transcriptional regulator